MRLEVGDQVAYLTIIGPVTTSGKKSYSPVRCICGHVRLADRSRLRSGDLKSCGCKKHLVTITPKFAAHLEKLKAYSFKHGHNTRKTTSPEYCAWGGVIQRCRNPRSKQYKWYGARGIDVCDRWLSFENFYADMGPRPKGMSLERKDNNLNYDKENCVWATRHEQMRNTRATRFVVVGDERLCVRDAAVKANVPESAIYWRVWRYGISHQDALEKAVVYARNTALGAMLGGG